jgi:hypothetical protein
MKLESIKFVLPAGCWPEGSTSGGGGGGGGPGVNLWTGLT